MFHRRCVRVPVGHVMPVQAVQAAQITFEDYFMADLAVAPLKIVGWEGVIGLLAMVAIMLPAVYFLPGVDGEGVHEDTIDSLHVRARPRGPRPAAGWRGRGGVGAAAEAA